MDNHYAVLNVAMDASEAVVRAAYRWRRSSIPTAMPPTRRCCSACSR
jgi:hypothetical protein